MRAGRRATASGNPTPPRGWGLLAIANVLAFSPLALLIGFLLLHGGESGAEIIVVAFAPLLLMVPLILVVDVVVAVRALRRGGLRGPRRIGAWATIAVGVTVLGLIGASLVSSVVDHYERTRLVSRSEAQTLVTTCNAESISRDDDTVSIRLRAPSDGQWIRKTAVANFDELVRAAREEREPCGFILTYDTRIPIARTFIDVPEALRRIDRCQVNGLNGVYFNEPGANGAGVSIGRQSDIGAQLRHRRGSSVQQIIITDPIAAAILVPRARAATQRCDELFIYSNGRSER